MLFGGSALIDNYPPLKSSEGLQSSYDYYRLVISISQWVDLVHERRRSTLGDVPNLQISAADLHFFAHRVV